MSAAEAAAEAEAAKAATEAAAEPRPGRYLIDGRSGSGKSELATAIEADWPELQLVRLDDLYPGWDGLAQGSAMVAGLLTTARWRSWDWSTDGPGLWRELDPSRPILVEGMGAISRTSRPLADAALWIDLDAPARKARALARDGALYAPHWDRWAAQEDALIARENPAALADEVVPGPDAAEHAARWRARLRAGRVDS